MKRDQLGGAALEVADNLKKLRLHLGSNAPGVELGWGMLSGQERVVVVAWKGLVSEAVGIIVWGGAWEAGGR